MSNLQCINWIERRWYHGDMKYPTAIMLAVGLFLVIGYFVYTKPPASPASLPTFYELAFPELSSVTDPVSTAASGASSVSAPARKPPEGMREYRSAAYRFSLFYPQELAVAERPEGGGAATVTFQNIEKAEGFQIFIVPYGEPQVSEKRFRQDVPSGVRESVTNIVVGGATGAAFYSTDAELGATREVWFVRGGFLYEVTTLKPLDAWLGEIIQTWRFL